MRTLSFFVLAICGSSAFAQELQDNSDKVPPPVNEALRARVNSFYQAHIDGKFRQADQYVAEDAKDAFFAVSKPRYLECNIAKINYSDDFTKATVITACKSEVLFHGHVFHPLIPISSAWKVESGLWWWYFVPQTEMPSPFGMMKFGPVTGDGVAPPAIPSDPLAFGRNILAQVTVDPTVLTIEQAQSSKHEIHVKNGLTGPITVSADAPGVPGLTLKPVSPQIPAGQEGVVMLEFNFDDPGIVCRDCLTHPGVRPPANATIQIEPTGQRFQIQIKFTQSELKK